MPLPFIDRLAVVSTFVSDTFVLLNIILNNVIKREIFVSLSLHHPVSCFRFLLEQFPSTICH